MTTKKFAKYLEKQCKEIINFSLEPLFGEYVVLVSGKRVGVIYQEKLYVLYAPTFENVEEMIPDFETVNLFSWAYLSFIEIKDIEDKEKLQDIINYVYHELYFAKDIVIDIGFLFQSFRGYPDRIYKLYQEHITFLHFAYEKNKIVLDFAKPPRSFKTRNLKLENETFKNVIIGWHDKYFRVVLELDKMHKYKLEAAENGYVLKLL